MSTANERLVAWGDELIKLHDGFRRDLADLRGNASIGPSLVEHCLAFCTAIDMHHEGEDDVVFPHLGGKHPELAEVLARLSAEHRKVARILADIRVLTEDGDPVIIGDELDRLACELEAHLDYEEEQLVPVLNQLTDMPDNI
jgi:iron-sulfur cluster repair protein YtfE (RIC family)